MKTLFLSLFVFFSFSIFAQNPEEISRQILQEYCDNVEKYSQSDDIKAHQNLLNLFENRNNLVYNDLEQKYTEIELYKYLQTISKLGNSLKVKFLQKPKNAPYTDFTMMSKESVIKRIKQPRVRMINGQEERYEEEVMAYVSEDIQIPCFKFRLDKETTTEKGLIKSKLEILVNSKTRKIMAVLSAEHFSADETQLTASQLLQKYYETQNKDKNKATLYLQKAAERNQAEAQYQYAYSVSGYESEKWLKKAHDNGHQQAASTLAKKFRDIANFSEAEKWFLEGVKKDSLALLELASLNRQLGKYEQAINYYTQFLNLKHNFGDTASLDSLSKINNLSRADSFIIALKKESIERNKSDIKRQQLSAMFDIGQTYYDLRKYEEAKKWYDKVLEQDLDTRFLDIAIFSFWNKPDSLAQRFYERAAESGDVFGMNKLAEVYDKQGKYAEAEKWYLKAIEKGYHKLMANLSILYQKQGKTEEAKKWYLKMEQYFVEKGEYKTLAHNAKYVLKNDKEAEKWYLKAIEKGDTSALFDIAQLYEKDLEDYEKAEKYYLVLAQKDHLKAMLNLANLYLSLGKYEEAEKYYLKLDKRAYLDDVYVGLAEAYEKQRKYEKAEEYYVKASQRDNYNLITLGRFYQNRELWVKAEECYLKALNNYATKEIALRILANTYAEQSRYEEAEKYLLQLIAVAEDKIFGYPVRTNSMRSELAKIYEQMGNLNKAEEWYRKAIRETLDDNAINKLLLFYKHNNKQLAFDTLYNNAKTYYTANLEHIRFPLYYKLKLAELYSIGENYTEAEKMLEILSQEKISNKSGISGMEIMILVLNVYEKQKNDIALETLCKQAIGKNVLIEEATQHLAKLYFRQNKYDESEKYFLEWNKLSPNNPEVLSALGYLAEQKGQNELAMKYYMECVQLGDTAVILYLANIYESNKDYERAKELYLLGIEKGSLSLTAKLADLYFTNGIYQDALKYYLQYYQYSNDNIGLYRIAVSYVTLNELVKADEYISAYLKEEPNDIYSHYIKANTVMYYDSKNELGLAKPHYEKFLSLIYNDKNTFETSTEQVIEAHLYLAEYYQKQKKTALAKEHYQKILLIEPTHTQALEALKK